MLTTLNKILYNRMAWLSIAIFTSILEVVALWFQYIIGLKPCELCIYERYALFGIVSAAIIAFIAPKKPLLYLVTIIWSCSAWKGIELSLYHINIQNNSLSSLTCDFTSSSPRWILYISKILSNYHFFQKEFLLLKIPKCLLLIFTIYFSISILILITQLFHKNSK